MLEQDPSTSFLDNAISRTLGETYGNLSRRSFLSGLTRRLIGLTSVAVAAEVLPFLAAPVRAANPYEVETLCGLHGYKCATGNCTGGVMGRRWVQCCEAVRDSCPTKWSCCRYTDYCGPTELQHSGCTGVTPGGTSWCGPAPNTFYRCTDVQCAITSASLYATEQACKTGCMTQWAANYCADDPCWINPSLCEPI
jgi:hypothetical protein